MFSLFLIYNFVVSIKFSSLVYLRLKIIVVIITPSGRWLLGFVLCLGFSSSC